MNTLMASARSLSSHPRTLLLTFDAFGTLFYPRPPVPQQYAAVAHEFGLSHSTVTTQAIQRAFGDVYRTHAKRWPNYGRADVLRGRYGGPRQWWEEVIRECFVRVLTCQGSHLAAQEDHQPPFELPPGMVQTLLDRFACEEGYALFDDVIPFFNRMRELRSSSRHFDRVVLGVVSNSDDRVPAVLKALGLQVGDLRADQDLSSMELPGFEQRNGSNEARSGDHSHNDLDFVITSYEAGEGKPNRLIFDIAQRQARLVPSTHDQAQGSFTPDETKEWVCVHVGDEYEKDYCAAINAGWRSYLIPRATGEFPIKPIASLFDLIDELKI
ncbi:unnamed protein product [Penicillium olsonii]|nr:unnamed protein product [Penicillium olsonii]CAG7929839.1 unnamed protein product [Penicillium olsonii]